MTEIMGAQLGLEAARRLTDKEGELRTGLTRAEFDRIEQQYGFAFADDHRAFLRAVLPVGGSWPDWRDGDPAALRERLAWPTEGVLFDVERNAYWHSDWGDRPARTAAAVERAREQLAMVPSMSARIRNGGQGQPCRSGENSSNSDTGAATGHSACQLAIRLP